MNLKSLIKAEKADLKTGEWKRGTIPRVSWPSRKARARAYKFGPQYQWRVISFSAAGRTCRVRLLLNENKQIFRATFGVLLDQDMVTLCDYEYHASEPGWHCHPRCDQVEDVNPATNRFGSTRIPGAKEHHRRQDFAVFKHSTLNAQTAFNYAAQLYRIHEQGSGML